MPNSVIWRFASTNLPHFKIKTIFGKFQKKLHHSYLLKYVSIKISNKDYRYFFATHISNISIHYHQTGYIFQRKIVQSY